MTVHKLALQVLERMERQEAELLAWGIVDGFFGEEEFYDLIAVVVDAYLDTLDHVDDDEAEDIDNNVLALLLSKGWVAKYQYAYQGQNRYRSRMAHSIGLLSKVKQLWPKHLKDDAWQHAPSLISDFRFALRPRAYPSRSKDPADLLSSESLTGQLSEHERHALAALVPGKLAKFQFDATLRIILEAKGYGGRGYRSSGTIISAGTGSGKTFAFYIPAMTIVAGLVDESSWTRVLALYPRKELLKDQFSEAYTLARKLDATLKAQGKRKIRIGALFGDTPFSGKDWEPPKQVGKRIPKMIWKRVGAPHKGYACPYFNCPSDGCTGEMIWRDEDRISSRERLHCSRCSYTSTEDEIILTRKRMQDDAPDFLFTTTEMLNQRLSDSWLSSVLGLVNDNFKRPRLMLLDEVHLHEGKSGAHVALLLRRWRKLTDASPHMVGLSATLRNARSFFGRLVGVSDHLVADIEAVNDEFAGMEYLLALRSDPASQKAIMSTTIQTAMTLGRMMDPIPAGGQVAKSGGVFGQKTFIFTDDLDVTNRLYFDLADAEGWMVNERQLVPKAGDGALAHLRIGIKSAQAMRLGQDWSFFKELGHHLDSNNKPKVRTGLKVSRTSAQDAGLDQVANLIVATASLEVGMNDPTVGVVIQHKAPRDAAAFLQRKGRAGRRRTMRPLTAVVLSDYGRDRLAYQGFESLFSPELPPRHLPIRNIYILRMQAVFTLIDWLSDKLSRMKSKKGSAWTNLAEPGKSDNDKERQIAIADLGERLLESHHEQGEFARYLREALGIDETLAKILMWEPPRAILTGVLPTMVRRIRTGWSDVAGEGDYIKRNNPLPEFVPGNLFSDLLLPEVDVRIPDEFEREKDSDYSMPIRQALSEFAPGRVSKRFGIKRSGTSHWFDPRGVNEAGQFDITTMCGGRGFDELGSFEYIEDDSIKKVRCIRPNQLLPQLAPFEISPSSKGRPSWNTQIVALSDGYSVALPQVERLQKVFQSVHFHLHAHYQPVEVRRFAFQASGTTIQSKPRREEWDFDLELGLPNVQGDADRLERTAIGFVLDVDGLCFGIKFPDDLHAHLSPELERELRNDRFKYLIGEDSTLAASTNTFQRDWLVQVFQCIITSLAIKRNQPLEVIWADELDERWPPSELLKDILSIVFQSIKVQSETGEDEDDSLGALQETLADLLSQPEVWRCFYSLAPAMWEPITDDWTPWLRKRFKATLGTALHRACEMLCDDMDASDLVLDLEPGPQADGCKTDAAIDDAIWLTESTRGGGGIIQELLRRYAEDSAKFFRFVEVALHPTDTEVANRELERFIEVILEGPNSTLAKSVAQMRTATTNSEYTTGFQELRSKLPDYEFQGTHGFVSTLANRILRPGTSSETDVLIRELCGRWNHAESLLGVELDARLFAYVQSVDEGLDSALKHLSKAPLQDNYWRFTAVYSLMWPRGGLVRKQALQTYNPFTSLPDTARLLVTPYLLPEIQVVDVSQKGWLEKVVDALQADAICNLRASKSNLTKLKAAMMRLLVHAVDTKTLLLHPSVSAIRPMGDGYDVTIELPEVLK